MRRIFALLMNDQGIKHFFYLYKQPLVLLSITVALHSVMRVFKFSRTFNIKILSFLS